MQRSPTHLLAQPRVGDLSKLLDEWEWLIGQPLEVLLVSALGDAFLTTPDGAVHALDTGAADLVQVADDIVEFRRMLKEPECVEAWFNPQLVTALAQSGAHLNPGQCYSYKIPPTLGGDLVADNLEPVDMGVHFHLLGQLQRQVASNRHNACGADAARPTE